MYAWIWRKLPFGLWGRLIGSVVLAGVMVAALWLVVFPWAEPLLPFDDVQVTEDGISGVDDGGEVPPGGEGTADPGAGDGHDVPYSTESHNPAPGATRTR